MSATVRVGLITAPSAEVGRKVAQALVEARLAACVNIVPAVESIYRWEGKVTTDAEVLLVVKTRAGLEESVVRAVETNHPYSCPEVVFLDVTAGRAAYLDWVAQETQS